MKQLSLFHSALGLFILFSAWLATVTALGVNERLFLEVPGILLIWALAYREDNLGLASLIWLAISGLVAIPEGVYALMTHDFPLLAVDLLTLCLANAHLPYMVSLVRWAWDKEMNSEP